MKIAKILSLVGLATCLAGASAQAKDWKTVRFGMDATYPPFENVDAKGQIVGFEVDYANALCAKMHVTCTFQNRTGGQLPSTGSNSTLGTVLRIGGIALAVGLILFGMSRRRRAMRGN